MALADVLWRFRWFRRVVWWGYRVTHWREMREAGKVWERLTKDQQAAVIQAVIEGSGE